MWRLFFIWKAIERLGAKKNNKIYIIMKIIIIFAIIKKMIIYEEFKQSFCDRELCR